MSDSWDRVEGEIEQFRTFLHPNFPPLKIEHLFDGSSLRDDWRHARKSGLLQMSGVYLIYGFDGNLIYIGKATARFEKRVKASFSECFPKADSVAVIAFPEGAVFLAYALEAFLISRLQVGGNTCGKGEYVDCRLIQRFRNSQNSH